MRYSQPRLKFPRRHVAPGELGTPIVCCASTPFRSSVKSVEHPRLLGYHCHLRLSLKLQATLGESSIEVTLTLGVVSLHVGLQQRPHILRAAIGWVGSHHVVTARQQLDETQSLLGLSAEDCCRQVLRIGLLLELLCRAVEHSPASRLPKGAALQVHLALRRLQLAA